MAAYPGNTVIANAFGAGLSAWWVWWQKVQGNCDSAGNGGVVRREAAGKHFASVAEGGDVPLRIKALLDTSLPGGLWPANGAAMAVALAPICIDPLFVALAQLDGNAEVGPPPVEALTGIVPRLGGRAAAVVADPAGAVAVALTVMGDAYPGDPTMQLAIMDCLLETASIYWLATSHGYNGDFATPASTMAYAVAAQFTP